MGKWQAPADAGPGVSVGGEFFPNVGGVITTPDGDYSSLLSHGYVNIPDDNPAPEPTPSQADSDAAEAAAAAQAASDAAAEAAAASASSKSKS